jgi:hypothetical protein
MADKYPSDPKTEATEFDWNMPKIIKGGMAPLEYRLEGLEENDT